TKHLPVLRDVILRIEIDSELHRVGDFLADRMQVHLELNRRSGQHQLSGVWSHQLALFADRPFHEQTGSWILAVVASACADDLRALGLPEPRKRVMRDAAALER